MNFNFWISHIDITVESQHLGENEQSGVIYSSSTCQDLEVGQDFTDMLNAKVLEQAKVSMNDCIIETKTHL